MFIPRICCLYSINLSGYNSLNMLTLLPCLLHVMHLSMLSPRVGGGGGADPGDFDISMEARVKFSTPEHLGNVKFPPLGDFVLLATCLSS